MFFASKFAIGRPSLLAWLRSDMTLRRCLLDCLLEGSRWAMQGTVVDVGGERVRQRGMFRPPANQGRWVYVNIDPKAGPDIVADAECLPLKTNSVDCVVCCEVLEHVRRPNLVVEEIHRVLRPGGIMILSVPFLDPIHEDPEDHIRLTDQGLRRLCEGFSWVAILPMGRTLGTVGTLLELAGREVPKGIIRRLLKVIGRTLSWFDLRIEIGTHKGRFTTGFFGIARKNGESTAS